MDRTKAIINKTIISVNGALYKQSSVIIDEINESDNKARVIDEMGRLFWVSLDDITIIKP
jgi:hypothetical protein|tara:strand:- start:3226 stop:3405 length:180 start_codon:yes stop_codon:yes gene_type:complete